MRLTRYFDLVVLTTFCINGPRLKILEAFHHPYYATGRSKIQREMYDTMERWFNGLGGEADETLRALTKVRIALH
jgi:Heterokaryon incompatibility protein Het-C